MSKKYSLELELAGLPDGWACMKYKKWAVAAPEDALDDIRIQLTDNRGLRALYEATVVYVESDADDISGIMDAFAALYGDPAQPGQKP